MGELKVEIEGPAADAAGQRIGVQAAVLAVLLALTSIASHRTHTHTVVVRSEANDKWQFYQSRRIKFHNLELGEDMLTVLAGRNGETAPLVQKYRTERQRYEREGKEASAEARQKEHEVAVAERRGLRYDIGEGLLEIGLVLTSLYFISRRKMFPAAGLAAGLAGAVIAATGLLL